MTHKDRGRVKRNQREGSDHCNTDKDGHVEIGVETVLIKAFGVTHKDGGRCKRDPREGSEHCNQYQQTHVEVGVEVV